MSEDKKGVIEEPVLEAPPEPEVSCTHGALLVDESFSVVLAKLAVAESLMKILTRNCNFQEFTRELLLSVMRVLQCEAGTIFEVDHNTNSLFFRSVVGQTSDRISKFVIPMGQGFVGHVAESRQALLVNNVGESKVHLKTIQNAVGFETRNLLAVPLLVRGQIFGVLELLNRVGEPEFTSADLELLGYLCELISKAIEVRLMISWAAQRTSDSKREAA